MYQMQVFWLLILVLIFSNYMFGDPLHYLKQNIRDNVVYMYLQLTDY